DSDATVKEGSGRIPLELIRSIANKHLNFLRSSTRLFSSSRGNCNHKPLPCYGAGPEKSRYSAMKDENNASQLGLYDQPLPCYGCGIGWFSFVVGFVCPPMWYYATVLYFVNHWGKDPRERSGLAASAIAALACTLMLLIVLLLILI
ncbi:hypothetical protein M569_10019, partial [Genlisea aurea]